MRKTREILRLLWHLGLGVRQTARSCQTSHATVVAYRTRAEEAREESARPVVHRQGDALGRHAGPLDQLRRGRQ